MAEERSYFRKCTTCRIDIDFEQAYFRCSVSTCNRKRLTLVFCSVPCWEAHLADARHRDAWAEKDQAPTLQAWEAERRALAVKDERRATPEPLVPRGAGRHGYDVLVVATKLKEYIRERASMSTSDRAFGFLSDHLRAVADQSARAAAADRRKTILDRDVRPLFERERRSLATGDTADDGDTGEPLVVVSKLKKYVRASSGMSTSDGIIPILSDHLRHLCREAIKNAGRNDRRTVMVQDFVAMVGD
jgi:histone H3/H4